MTPRSKVIYLATILFLACITITLTSSAYNSTTASAKVSAKTGASDGLIGIYLDNSCTQKLTTITWGAILQGSATNQTIYIKNLSTSRLTLSMTTENWSPPAANGPIALTWNCEKATVKPNETIPAMIKLEVASSATNITTFTMDITITGTSMR